MDRSFLLMLIASFPLAEASSMHHCDKLAFLGQTRDCCMNSGTCGGSSCKVFGVPDTAVLSCDPKTCPGSRCAYHVDTCTPGTAHDDPRRCFGRVRCSEGVNCVGSGQLCLDAGSEVDFIVCAGTLEPISPTPLPVPSRCPDFRYFDGEHCNECLCATKKCPAHALCSGTTGRCVCEPGYVDLTPKDHNVSCIPINPCWSHTDNCNVHDHEICVSTEPGRYECRCAEGYYATRTHRTRVNHTLGLKCAVLDPCLAHTDTCDVDAHEFCLHVGPGQYECQCAEGYFNNQTFEPETHQNHTHDVKCIPINPCLNPSTNDCMSDAHEVCGSPAKGEYMCFCADGYVDTNNDTQKHSSSVTCEPFHRCPVDHSFWNESSNECECEDGYHQRKHRGILIRCEEIDVPSSTFKDTVNSAAILTAPACETPAWVWVVVALLSFTSVVAVTVLLAYWLMVKSGAKPFVARAQEERVWDLAVTAMPTAILPEYINPSDRRLAVSINTQKDASDLAIS